MSRLHEQLRFPNVPPPPEKVPAARPPRTKVMTRVVTPAPELPFDTPVASPVPRTPEPAPEPARAPTPVAGPPAPKPVARPEPKIGAEPQRPAARASKPANPAAPVITARAPRDVRPLGGKPVLVVFLLICGALMYAMAHRILTTGPVTLTPPELDVATTAPLARPPIQLLATDPAPLSESEIALAEPAPAVAPAAEPDVEPSTSFELVVTGARVEERDGSLVVTFDEGIFSKVDQLRPDASDALQDLARQLAPLGDRVSVLVTGHTDNEPVPKNRPYKTNYDLGMLRALAVANHLIDNAGMSRSAVSTRSLGEKGTPYPNDSAENRAKNRTVVITIRL